MTQKQLNLLKMADAIGVKQRKLTHRLKEILIRLRAEGVITDVRADGALMASTDGVTFKPVSSLEVEPSKPDPVCGRKAASHSLSSTGRSKCAQEGTALEALSNIHF